MKKIISIAIAILIILGGAFFAVRTLLFPVKYKSDIKSISSEYKIDPYVLATLAHFESRFDDKKYEKNSNNGILRFSDKSSTELAKELNMSGFTPKDLVNEKLV
ncbi:transglycosylase SLT domain-containing protein [Clostridium sp. CCUG 7971]|uniref:transglycosylase SLT domain-containing protein n=1 Tax=Clostridium sp. CCUG 7971 TaxID=2811414 RepID=UPI001ABA7533|nr:transglycosylase SLT domain-containing protein [Clostridium sp. CCUG 7971]MBO3444710.1 transglycosylase SLT domain-containing protein [Clostridium sp. CCUG 7971]